MPLGPRLSRVAGAALLLLCGCSTAARGPGEDLARTLSARGLDPQALTIPWKLPDELRGWAHAQVPRGTPREKRLDVLLRAMTDPRRLDLQYEAGQTATAAEAFASRRANCMGFSSLFVGLAREVGMPVFFLLVEDVERFERDGDLLVVSGHITAGFEDEGGLRILDFTPGIQPNYRNVERLPDLRALALFHSNRGAELLRAGQREEALEWLGKATAIDPDLTDGWINLGVVRRRSGDAAGAEAAYRRALAADPRSAAAYQNLSSLLRSQGRGREADELQDLAARFGLGEDPW
jgi:tetratricopeptide (TPR) repeat protein